MSRPRKSRAHMLAAAAFLLLGALVLLGCQPAQPVATPKAGETPAAAATTAKPAATTAAPAATKAPEKAAEKPVRGGTLRVVLTSDPNSLDPQAVTRQHPPYSLNDYMIALDTALAVTKDGLFKDWTISGDGKAITFKLREGVKFHDGTDWDAASAKYQIDRMKDPALKSPYASNYDAVTSVDIVDNLTVRFNLKQPDPLLLPRMGTQGGMVVSQAAVAKLGQDFGRKPVGTGAFEFVEWVPGDHITLKRFNGYWRKDKDGNQLPYLDGVVFKVITDPSTAMANLRTGQVDLYSGSGGLPPEQLPLIKNDPNLYYTIDVGPGVSGIDMNTKKPPFDNKALRQAVALAIDREGMAALFGEGVQAWASIYHPRNWGFDAQTAVFPKRDVAKAKAKMAEAGYPSGGVKVKYISQSSPDTVKRSEVVKANLAEIGIDAEIEVVASAVWLSRVSSLPPTGGDYTISSGALGNALGDPGHTHDIMFNSKGTRNYFGPYSNPKVDELLNKAGAIYDQKERTTLYQEATKLIVDDVPFIPTQVSNNIAGMNKKTRNFPRYADNRDQVTEVWLAP